MKEEKRINEAVIIIDKIIEVTENTKGCFKNDDKFICIKVIKNNTEHSTCFKSTKEVKKQLLEFIKENLHIT